MFNKINNVTTAIFPPVMIFGLGCLAATAYIQRQDNENLRAISLANFQYSHELKAEINSAKELLNNLQTNITEKYAPHSAPVNTNLTYLSDGITNSVTE